MAEHTIMITMPLSELKQMMQETFESAFEKRFEPLRKQFEDRLITANETSEKLGVTRQTLHNLEKRKELMPVRVGGKVQYRESDIIVYMRRKDQ